LIRPTPSATLHGVVFEVLGGPHFARARWSNPPYSASGLCVTIRPNNNGCGGKQPFSYIGTCVNLDPHVGGNPATAQEAQKAVSGFLQALFKLG